MVADSTFSIAHYRACQIGDQYPRNGKADLVGSQISEEQRHKAVPGFNDSMVSQADEFTRCDLGTGNVATQEEQRTDKNKFQRAGTRVWNSTWNRQEQGKEQRANRHQYRVESQRTGRAGSAKSWHVPEQRQEQAENFSALVPTPRKEQFQGSFLALAGCS